MVPLVCVFLLLFSASCISLSVAAHTLVHHVCKGQCIESARGPIGMCLSTLFSDHNLSLHCAPFFVCAHLSAKCICVSVLTPQCIVHLRLSRLKHTRHVYMHTHTHTRAHTLMCVLVYMYTRTYMYVHIYIYVHIICIYIYILLCIYIFIYTYTFFTYVYIFIYI